MKTLKSASLYAEGEGISIVITALGVCFMTFGLYFAGVFQNRLHATQALYTLPIQIFIGLGVMLLWRGLSQMNLDARFASPVATASGNEVSPGEAFEFSYRLPVRRDTQIENIGVFLVLRERVSYSQAEETTTVDIDRLYQEYNLEGRMYRKQDAIEVQQTFCVPEGDRGLRNSFMNRRDAKAARMWVVKVRLHRSEGEDVWSEYDLEASFSATTTYVPDPERYDVWLVEAPMKKILTISSAVRLLLPHLRSGQFGDLWNSCPCLLMEERTYEEAQRAKDSLESAGAIVEIYAANGGRKDSELR